MSDRRSAVEETRMEGHRKETASSYWSSLWPSWDNVRVSSYAGETGTFRLVKAGNLINSHNCKALKQDVNPLNREVTPYFQTTHSSHFRSIHPTRTSNWNIYGLRGWEEGTFIFTFYVWVISSSLAVPYRLILWCDHSVASPSLGVKHREAWCTVDLVRYYPWLTTRYPVISLMQAGKQTWSARGNTYVKRKRSKKM